jgi:hypothetical protein
MAFSHLHFNDQTPYGRLLRRALNMNEESDEALKDVRDLMSTMINGDGSADAHYTELTTRFGFGSDADAHAAFLETDTCYSKTSGNASVTNVRAARDQWFSKLRG